MKAHGPTILVLRMAVRVKVGSGVRELSPISVMFTKLTVEAEPLRHRTTFAANHTTKQARTGQSRARQGAGSSNGFFARGSGRLKKITKQSQLECKPIYFNNLTHNR